MIWRGRVSPRGSLRRGRRKAGAGHGVEGVGQRDDLRAERNLLVLESFGVAATVGALVVIAGHERDVCEGVVDGAQYLVAGGGVAVKLRGVLGVNEIGRA